jgi:hypothetical protein
MYQVYFKDYPLHDPRSVELQLREPAVHLAVNESGAMSFTIDRDHPNEDKLTRLKGVLKLTAGGVPIFRGRIRKDTSGFYLSRRIEVEGLLACLNDSIIPPFNFPGDFEEDAAYQAAAESGNVIQFFLDWILAEHNSQVGPDQQIILGDVTVTDPNNYISRASSEYLTAMEAVRKKLHDLLGGYLLADYSGETTRLHYYADLPLTNMQSVEFGKNLLDLESEIEAADTCTAILPIGKDGLTIESLGDGELSPGIWKEGRIIYSTDAEDAIGGGRITRPVKWDDVTLPENLRAKAVTELTTNGMKHVQTITVKALDLGGVDDIPRFMVGRYVQFKSPPHGFADAYPLMELEPNILDPGDTEITLGATVKTASDLAHGNQSATEERQDQQQIELNKQDQAIKDLAETTQTQITQAIQTAESIIFSALESYVKSSDYEEYKKTVSSELEILAERISLNFEQTIEQIEDVNGDLRKTVEKLEKHFDFGLNGLGIRAGDNAMTLTLDNDLVIFKKNGQPFGWWDGVDFHTGNIVIDVTERAQFGSFAFVPRSNGSLDFLKVSDVSTAKTLLSISATYSGGVVPAGTALSALTGIIVTAIYSDNSTEIVEGYSMSGTINEGENLIAITYGDKVTSVTVIGEVVLPGDGDEGGDDEGGEGGGGEGGGDEGGGSGGDTGDDTDGFVLGDATNCVAVTWFSNTANTITLQYSDAVTVADGVVTMANPKTTTFHKTTSGKTNDYSVLLGKYVKSAYSDDILYISPTATHSHNTEVSIVVAENIVYTPAYLVIPT